MTKRDGLKPLDQLCEVDVRNTHFVSFNQDTKEIFPATVEDHYAKIAQFSLNDDVPGDVATQFDVARNLYLYSWFEYRFFNVAEAHALNALELAMKKRIGKDAITRYIKQRNRDHKEKTGRKGGIRNGMKTLIEYCRDHQLVQNEGFSEWHRYPSIRAYHIALHEQTEWAINEMQRTGETEIDVPDIKFEKLPPDPNYDHIQHLIDHTHRVRNNYSHGSTTLHNMVLGTFEMVSEFTNQLYPQ